MTPDEIADLIASAELGDADAQVEIAARLATGDAVAQDLKRATEWYARAASQGNADATYNLALMYLMGEGVEKSEDTAKRMLHEAARLGSADAHFVLGDAYLKGAGGLSKDWRESLKHYLASSPPGAARSLRCIGSLLLSSDIDDIQLSEVGKLMADFDPRKAL